jgi:hypothetical protein
VGVISAPDADQRRSEAEFVDQLSDAAFDIVADGADTRGVQTSRVVQVGPRIRSVCPKDIGRCLAVSSLQTIRRCTTEASLHPLPSRGLTASLVNRLTLSRVPAVGTSR